MAQVLRVEKHHNTYVEAAMQMKDIHRDVLLRGEVVETFEKNGKQVAKIALNSFHLEIPTEFLDSAHLGDRVHLSVTITIDTLESSIKTDNSDHYS